MNHRPLSFALAGLLALSIVPGGIAVAEERGDGASTRVSARAEATPLSIAARRVLRTGQEVRLVIRTRDRADLAALGVDVGAPIGQLPQSRASASGEVLARIIAAGLAHTVSVDRLVPLPANEATAAAADSPYTDAADIVGAAELRSQGITGAGTAVAVLDTGIDAGHPYFKRGSGTAIAAQGCFVTYIAEYPPELPCAGNKDSVIGPGAANVGDNPNFWHGTHVAGIIAGNPTGIPEARNAWGMAPDTKLVVARVFGDAYAYDSDILAGLDWVRSVAAQHNIVAVNLSLGYFGGNRWDCTVDTDPIYGTAVQRLAAAGVAFVAAAGNEGNTTAEGSPACTTGAVSVGATDAENAIAEFSNIASATDLVAPGVDIYSSVNGGGFAPASGTSMATPVVAGSYALAHQAKSGLDNSSWLAIFRSTGTSIDDVVVKGLPLLRISTATRQAQGISIPGKPAAVTIKEQGLSSVTVTWSAPATSPAPDDYVITVGNRTVVAKASPVTVTGVLSTPASVQVVGRIAGIPGPTASGPRAFPVDASLGTVVGGLSLGATPPQWNYCQVSAPALSLMYAGPEGTPMRTLRVTNGTAVQVVNEAAVTGIPGFDRSMTITDRALWTDPATVAQVVGSGNRLGPRWSLGWLVMSAESYAPPPPQPTQLVASGKSRSISVTWNANGAKAWEVYLDGKSVVTTRTPSATLKATPGRHTVGVCSLSDSGSPVRGSSMVTATAVVPRP